MGPTWMRSTLILIPCDYPDYQQLVLEWPSEEAPEPGFRAGI